MSYAFAAAGTGGHVYPALAVADRLVASGVDRDDILFVGGDRMEATVVPAAGYPFCGVEIRGLQRRLTAANLSLPGLVWRAAGRIRDEIVNRRVAVAAVFGGYVAVPTAWAAQRTGATLFVQEQNAVPGLANRLVARRAAATFIAFRDAATRLPRTRLTGNPLRREIAAFDRSGLRAAARARYGLDPEALVVGVLGGSLGAGVLNDAAAGIAHELGNRRDVQLLHLTGTRNLAAVLQQAEVLRESAGSPVTWRPIGFEDAMEYFYAAVDMVLSRAGALTISELTATGTPAVVVPYAAGTAGHQAANAAELVAAGGARLVPEEAAARLPGMVIDLADNPEQRVAMAAASGALGRPDAADVIARTLAEAHDG